MQENLGHELGEGTHVVRVFPSRAQHESVKTDGAFAMVTFNYRAPPRASSFDPDAPLLTYSRPKGCYTAGERILLDFYLTNAELSAERQPRALRPSTTRVEGDITEWAPHWIENLPAVEHTMELSLVDAEGQPCPARSTRPPAPSAWPRAASSRPASAPRTRAATLADRLGRSAEVASGPRMASLLDTVRDLDRLRQIVQVLIRHGFGEVVQRTGLGSLVRQGQGRERGRRTRSPRGSDWSSRISAPRS